MMNLQELQTLQHHNLKVKIILLNNDGYLTIAHTHRALFKNDKPSAVMKSGVSFPNFMKLAEAFGHTYMKIENTRI